MSKPIEIGDQDFGNKVLAADRPVLVDFWAPWCGPCRMVAPVLEELAGEYADRLTIAKMNTDEHQETAFRFGIRGIPTLILFSGGREVERIVGALPKPALQARLEAALGAQTGASSPA
jgi:thioredoxin 1